MHLSDQIRKHTDILFHMLRIILHAVCQIPGIQQFIDNTVALPYLYHIVGNCCGDTVHEGHFGFCDFILHHSKIDAGAEDLHNGIRIQAIDAGRLSPADHIESFHTDLTDRFPDGQNLGEAGHIQNVINFGTDIDHRQICTQCFFRLQQNTKACRRDIY